MPSPVFTGDPPRPLFIPGNGDVLVPALADDPCACCEDSGGLTGCNACLNGIAAATCTVEISGVTVTGTNNCYTFRDCNAFNGVFVLDILEANDSTNFLNRCDYILEGLDRVFCVGNLTTAITKIGVQTRTTAVTVDIFTEQRTTGGTLLASGWLQNFGNFNAAPNGLNCVSGSYLLDPVQVLGSSIDCTHFAGGSATVTFNG